MGGGAKCTDKTQARLVPASVSQHSHPGPQYMT